MVANVYALNQSASVFFAGSFRNALLNLEYFEYFVALKQSRGPACEEGELTTVMLRDNKQIARKLPKGFFMDIAYIAIPIN
jgi:hypothetical protein